MKIIKSVPDLKVYSDKDEITFMEFPWIKDPVQYVGFGERGGHSGSDTFSLKSVALLTSSTDEQPLMIIRADKTKEYVSEIEILRDKIVLKGA